MCVRVCVYVCVCVCVLYNIYYCYILKLHRYPVMTNKCW